MKRSEIIKRWFAVMKALEKQQKMVALIQDESKEAITQQLHNAISEVDQILSCKYRT